MQAIRAIYDGINFMPIQPIPVRGKCEVIITFLETAETTEPVNPVISAGEPVDYIEKLCGSLADYPEMSVDKFLERTRKDRDLEL